MLGLSEIGELTPDTKLDAGLLGGDKETDFNKKSVLADLGALAAAVVKIDAGGLPVYHAYSRLVPDRNVMLTTPPPNRPVRRASSGPP